jgi:hypothetical protein
VLGLLTLGGAVVFVVGKAISKIKKSTTSHTDEEKIEMLKEAVEQGWSATQAGKKFNLSDMCILRWSKKFGIVLVRVRSSDCSHCGQPLSLRHSEHGTY